MGGTLEERELRHLVDQRRHDLDRARASSDDADTLARQINLLMEGAIVTAYVAGIADTAGQAKDAAQILIAAAIPPTSSAA